MRIEIEILRIAERREHAAQIGRDVLQDERDGHIAFLARRVQHEIAQRQERDERHVVGDEHRADERDIDQRQHAQPRVPEQLDDPAGEDIEKVDVPQRAHHRQYAEKAGERLEIKIVQIGAVGRHDERCDQRGEHGHAQHGVLLKKSADRGENGAGMQTNGHKKHFFLSNLRKNQNGRIIAHHAFRRAHESVIFRTV